MKKALLILSVLAIFGIIPFVVDAEGSFLIYFLFITFIYVTLAQGWNLVAGYAGQISLGTHTFFGIGAYVTALIWLYDLTKTSYYFDPLVMFLSGLVPALFAASIGIPLLSRLRGDSFAFGTLGVGFIITVICLKFRKITGGADGLHLPAEMYSSMGPYYWTSFAIAVGSTLLVYAINKSSLGLALKAIREDEISAACRGVPILRFKIFAFSVSAFLAGVAGSLYSIYLFHINPDSVLNLNWLFYPILVCVLGGNGTILGPVIGAFFAAALFAIGDLYFTQLQPVFSGLLILVIMKFLPGGLLSLLGSERKGYGLKKLLKRRAS